VAKTGIQERFEKITEIPLETRSLEMKPGTHRIRTSPSVRWRGGKIIYIIMNERAKSNKDKGQEPNHNRRIL
jgi:hypothetical protein